MSERSDEVLLPAGEDPLAAQTRRDALVRLHRAHGQLGGVINMIDGERPATEVLTQLAAVLHALHRASFRLVAAELEGCESIAASRTARRAELEKLFLALG